MHEPLVEVLDNKNKLISKNKEKNELKTKVSIKKSKKNDIKTIKTRIKKKKKTIKKVNKGKEETIDLDKKEIPEKNIDDKDEKSGWWSA